MMISVPMVFCNVQKLEALIVLGLYSLLPPAVILLGFTPNCVCKILATEVALSADKSPVVFW